MVYNDADIFASKYKTRRNMMIISLSIFILYAQMLMCSICQMIRIYTSLCVQTGSQCGSRVHKGTFTIITLLLQDLTHQSTYYLRCHTLSDSEFLLFIKESIDAIDVLSRGLVKIETTQMLQINHRCVDLLASRTVLIPIHTTSNNFIRPMLSYM